AQGVGFAIPSKQVKTLKKLNTSLAARDNNASIYSNSVAQTPSPKFDAVCDCLNEFTKHIFVPTTTGATCKMYKMRKIFPKQRERAS
ncbi:MAG: hypothetical protein ACRD38_09700, partial [Nitrososphaerales archaeon]